MGAARYSEEFKQDAAKLVASTGRSVNSVAKDLGINTESLWQRVRAAEAAQAYSAIRSIGRRVPSRITNAVVRMVFIPSVRFGARAARASMTSRM